MKLDGPKAEQFVTVTGGSGVITASYELTAEEVTTIRSALLFVHAYPEIRFVDCSRQRVLEIYNKLHWPGPEPR